MRTPCRPWLRPWSSTSAPSGSWRSTRGQASPDVATGTEGEVEAEAEAEGGSSREAGVAAPASNSRAVEGAGVEVVAAAPKLLPLRPLRLSRALQARALPRNDR